MNIRRWSVVRWWNRERRWPLFGWRELQESLDAQRKANVAMVEACLGWERRVYALRAQVESLEKQLAMEREFAKGSALPGLSSAEMERLAILAEECGEAVQMCGKILWHGFESCSPYDDRCRPNRVLLERELGDVRGVIDLMLQRGDVRAADIAAWRSRKQASLRKWTHHQFAASGEELAAAGEPGAASAGEVKR